MSKAPCLVLHYDSYHIHGRINLILSLQIQNPVAVSFKHEQYANLIRHRFFHVLSYQSTALSHLQIFLIFQLWRVGPLDFYREGNNSTYESDWKKRKDMVSGLTRNTHLLLALPWQGSRFLGPLSQVGLLSCWVASGCVFHFLAFAPTCSCNSTVIYHSNSNKASWKSFA
jgi:hypothetical protein